MKTIQEKFEYLGLPSQTKKSYEGADSFSKQYKKCSVLDHGAITYSTNSGPTSNNRKGLELEPFKIRA